MITREHYLRQIRPFYGSDLIKVVTGIRRCGKSVILDQIREEIDSRGGATLYLNFENLATSATITTAEELIAYVDEHRSGDSLLYVFLDEVQLLDRWNIACRTLRLNNCSVFVTGSNSTLLSGEFIKELTGRYVSFHVRPFVYREAREYCTQLGKELTVTDYLIHGGFPQRFEFDDEDAVRRYLADIDRTIVVNDIIARYHIRKTDLFTRFVNFVLSSNARIFSAHSVRKYLEGQNVAISTTTVTKYLEYLKEAYVIRSIPQYSTKAKRALTYREKLYDEDVAFNSIRRDSARPDLTHNLENVVYNELIYRGYEVFVYNDARREIDFLARRDGKEYLVQVAYSVAEPATYEREFAAFNRADQSRKKLLITADPADYSTSTVAHVQLERFLECESLAEL